VKILLVSHSAQPGGSNTTIASLLQHRPADADCSIVFLENGPVLGQLRALGYPAALVDAGRAREAWRAPGVVGALRRAITAHRADVVFAHVTKAHLYASAAARLARVPYLWWQHERRSQKPIMHLLSGWLPADAVICSSDWTAAEQRAPKGGRVWTIHPGAELDPAPRRHSHRAGADGPVVIGVVGRLQRWKRVELALQTMRIVLQREPQARMRVIGGATPGLDEGYDGELRRLVYELEIENAVDFVGHADDVDAELAELDILLHTAQAEPFGLVLVESMARAVPVVAVAEGGPTEIVRPGEDGLLCDDDPAGLAEAVLNLARDPERRAAMGERARERALKGFGATRMADEAWALVRSVASDKGAQAR